MKKPLIGIMISKPKPLKDYAQAKRLNVDLLVFRPGRIMWSKKKIRGYLFRNGKWRKKTSSFPAVIYNRLYSSKRRVVHKLERAIGKGKVFNCVTRFDKWVINRSLRNSPVRHHVPVTFLYQKSNIVQLLQKYGKLILKPCKGQLGRRVYLIERTNNNEFRLYTNLYSPRNNTPYEPHAQEAKPFIDPTKAQNHTTDERDLVKKITEFISDESNVQAKINTTNAQVFRQEVHQLIGKKRFLVQQFIPLDRIDQKIYDIRIYVQKNHQGKWTVSGGFSRVGQANSYISNLITEITSIPAMLRKNNRLSTGIFARLGDISLQAALSIERQLGHLGEMSVDFGLDHDGHPWIIEVNGKTQKKFVKRAKDAKLTRDVYLKPIDYARFLASRK